MRNLISYARIMRANARFWYRNPRSLRKRTRNIAAISRQASTVGDAAFFIIAVPGCLHVLEACLRFVPKETRLVVVANGLDAWEILWLHESQPTLPLLVCEDVLPHGDVIQSLVRSGIASFGLLDYDCFVFKSSLFSEAQQLSEWSHCNALFTNQGAENFLDLPETYFMFINAEVYRHLMGKYRVDCGKTSYWQLPRKARIGLKKVGVNRRRLPEGYKGYFDTLRVIWCLAQVDGWGVTYLRQLPPLFCGSGEAIHVGGVSEVTRLRRLWGVRGSFLWRSLLESHPDEELRERYGRKYGKMSPEEVLASFPGSRERIGATFFSFVDDLASGRSLV